MLAIMTRWPIITDTACPTGWLTLIDGDQENCYFISNTTATLDEARSTCRQLSAPVDSYMWAPNTKSELVSNSDSRPILPYLPYVFGQTGLKKQCRAR